MTGERLPQTDHEALQLLDRVRDEIMDPKARILLDAMQGVRSWMREHTTPAERLRLNHILHQANNELYNQGLFGTEVLLASGKLRPAKNYSDYDDDREGDVLDEPRYMSLARQLELGEVHYDDDGPYFLIAGRPVHSGEFTAYYGTNLHNGIEDGFVLWHVITQPDEESDDTAFVMMLDDIELLNTKEPSDEMAAIMLEREFPDIFKQLQKLPEGSHDKQNVVTALNDFTLHITWPDYIHHNSPDQAKDLEALQELESLIGQYITSRLNFDGGWHTAKIKGHVAVPSLTKHGIEPKFSTIKKPKKYHGPLAGVSLLEMPANDETPEGAIPYILKLTILSRLDGGSFQQIDIPGPSLMRLKSLSGAPVTPNALMFPEHDEELALSVVTNAVTDGYAHADSDVSVRTVSAELLESAPIDDEPEMESMFDDGATQADDDKPPREANIDNIVDLPPRDYINAQIEIYDGLESRMEAYMSLFGKLYERLFDTQEEASEALMAAHAKGIELVGDFLTDGYRMEFNGKEIKMMRITVEASPESSTDEIRLVAKSRGIVSGQSDLRAVGAVQTAELSILPETEKHDDEEGNQKYRACADLVVYTPADTISRTLTESGSMHRYFELNTMQVFRVAVNESTNYKFVNHDWLTRTRERLEQFEDDYPETKEIVADLFALFKHVSILDFLNDKGQLDTSQLRSFADYSAKTPAQAHDLAMILTDIFEEKIVQGECCYFSDDGVFYKDKPLPRALVSGVFTPESGPGANELCMVMRIVGTSETVRVPMSKISRLLY